MKYLTVAFCLFCFVHLSAQVTSEELLEDIVELNDGRFTASHNYLLKITGTESNIQVSTYSECPIPVISRDNFIAISTMVFVKFIDGMAQGQEHEIHDLDEIIGSPDIEMNLYMAKQGVQFELKADGEVFRETYTWDDM